MATTVIGSMPIIPGTATGPVQHLPPDPSWHESDDSRMRRSASSPQLSDVLETQTLHAKSRPIIIRNHSTSYLTAQSLNEERQHPPQPPPPVPQMPLNKQVRRSGMFRNARSSSTKSKNALTLQQTVPYESTAAGEPPRMEARSLAMSDAFANFASSISRSPSPSVKDRSLRNSSTNLTELDIKAKIQNARNGIPSVNGNARVGRPVEQQRSKRLSRKNTSPSKEKRPMSVFMRTSSSANVRGALNHSRSTSSPPTPRQPSVDLASAVGSPIRRKFPTSTSTAFPPTSFLGMDKLAKPDELIRQIITLEGEYEKFDVGTMSMKISAIRQTLSPFLRDYAHHPSNKSLRPEDLDRRTVIFDKWWRGMLHMIGITGERAVSLGDRQTLFSAVSAIMMRPEWRIPPSDCAPVRDTYPRAMMSVDSATSTESGSDFVTDSIHHNIRNTFSANLLSQMAFVVTSLSQRTATPSLVAFCGKACAYAFFFSPGVAEILIDLWQTPVKAYQRVLDEFGVGRNFDFHGKFEDIVDGFPRCIQSLRFVSFDATLKARRKRRDFLLLPPSIELIDWKGPWVARWCGRESDLFFVFLKYFNILFADFIPPSTTVQNHLCAPAFLQVHSQMLVTFDQVLQRKPQTQAEFSGGPAPITFDDVLEKADTTAAALQLPFSEHSKSMAENRLILLLRDYISESSIDSESSRRVFIKTFSTLFKAAVKRVSMFDQTACFTLCEFTEEALELLLCYQHENRISIDLVDLPFWIDVWHKMINSHNNMVAIRVLTTLYCIWESLILDEKRREKLALGWLLSESDFGNFFTHWCPMNRAYFLRLLCWRVVRSHGEPSELDLKIFFALSTRLKTTWATFQALQDKLKETRQLPANTAPSNPAPGRKFLIMTMDYRPPITASAFTFDGINPSIRNGNSPSPPSSLSEQNGNKKPWKAIRSMIGLGNGVSSPTSPSFPPPSVNEPSLRQTPKRKDSKNGTSKTGGSDRPPACFKFSLAWLDGPQAVTRPRYLHPPRLPTQAESYLRKKMTGAIGVKPQVNETESKSLGLKYAGRALAEWASVVGEFQGFCEKRIREGDGDASKVETPALTVESFKKLGLGV